MKDWIVETRVISRRVYLVQAEDEKEAIFNSTHVPPESDEDEFEETMSVVENIPSLPSQEPQNMAGVMTSISNETAENMGERK